MTTTRPFRELILDLCEVSDTTSAVNYANRMLDALRNKEIRIDQFTGLYYDFEKHCISNKITINLFNNQK